jgi:hypothetical protein
MFYNTGPRPLFGSIKMKENAEREKNGVIFGCCKNAKFLTSTRIRAEEQNLTSQ